MTNSSAMAITFSGLSTNALISPDGDIRLPLDEIAIAGMLNKTHLRTSYATTTVFFENNFIETLSLKDSMEALESV